MSMHNLFFCGKKVKYSPFYLELCITKKTDLGLAKLVFTTASGLTFDWPKLVFVAGSGLFFLSGR